MLAVVTALVHWEHDDARGENGRAHDDEQRRDERGIVGVVHHLALLVKFNHREPLADDVDTGIRSARSFLQNRRIRLVDSRRHRVIRRLVRVHRVLVLSSRRVVPLDVQRVATDGTLPVARRAFLGDAP